MLKRDGETEEGDLEAITSLIVNSSSHLFNHAVIPGSVHQ